MTDLLKIGAAFALIVILLRVRWNLGAVMLLASALIGVLYRIAPLEQTRVALRSCFDPVTLNLVGGLVLIMALENIIRKRGLLARMTGSLSRIARDQRITMAVLPGVIGLLPSAGGAAFSAPMVQEAASGTALSPERRAFINYWFRHIWEYCSPLYPGVMLTVAITGLSLNRFMLSQLTLATALIATGALLCFRGTTGGTAPEKQRPGDGKDLFVSLMPILAAIILVAVLHVPLAPAMAAIVAALFLRYRYSREEIIVTLRESIMPNVILMVAGVMVFKGMLDASGAIEALPRFFRDSGLPITVVFFALPFIVGLVTGLTVAFVGSTFPIIVAMTGGHPDTAAVTFAFASGFAGVMLSPTHLCLLLTVRYFKADLAGTYRLLYLPVALVFAAGLIRLWL